MAEPQTFISTRHNAMVEALGESEARELAREIERHEAARRLHEERIEADMRRGRWLPAGDLDSMIAEIQDESAEEISRLTAELEQIQMTLERNEYSRLMRQLAETREELDQVRSHCTARQDRLAKYLHESMRIAEYAKRNGMSFDAAVKEAQQFNSGGGF